MSSIPHITVQLVHIQGPLKGDIQDFSDEEIRIGRHPDCQVNYPKDLVTLSRVHARIVREGNRFKIIDQSTNGTYVNGLRVAENYLKDGDVLMFSEGGPKASFLTQTSAQTAAPTPPSQSEAPVTPRVQMPAPQPPPSPPRVAQPSLQDTPPIMTPQPPAAPPILTPAAAAPPAVEVVKVPFAIQYGPALKSFQTLPIILGSGAGCDFPIAHPALKEQHVQIFFAQNQYWVRDLTGMAAVMINGQPIAGQAALAPDMQLSLTSQGPKFRFIGGGRLAEVEDPLPEPVSPPQPVETPAAPHAPKERDDTIGKKAGTLFKKFFS